MFCRLEKREKRIEAALKTWEKERKEFHKEKERRALEDQENSLKNFDLERERAEILQDRTRLDRQMVDLKKSRDDFASEKREQLEKFVRDKLGGGVSADLMLEWCEALKLSSTAYNLRITLYDRPMLFTQNSERNNIVIRTGSGLLNAKSRKL